MKEITTKNQYDQLIEAKEDFILFKNSSTCIISGGVCKEIYQAILHLWLNNIYKLEVLDYPELKYYVAQKTWIKHESPQCIIYKKWSVFAVANHYDITYDRLKNNL